MQLLGAIGGFARSMDRAAQSMDHPDTPQFRGGNPYFFRENPYQSVSFIYASMYSENIHAIHTIPYQFTKKIATLQQRTKIGALGHMARQSD